MYRFTRIVLANYRRFNNAKNQIDFAPNFPKFDSRIKFTMSAGILGGLFGKQEEPSKQESDLIMAIKRGRNIKISCPE